MRFVFVFYICFFFKSKKDKLIVSVPSPIVIRPSAWYMKIKKSGL